MAFTTIAAPNDPSHWIDVDKARAWLKRALDLSNPSPTSSNNLPAARQVLNNGGASLQLLGVTAAWEALRYYYRALDLQPGTEETYVNSMREAYGQKVDVTDAWIRAYGYPVTGWIPQHALDAIEGSKVRAPIPSDVEWIVRAYIVPSGGATKVQCPDGTHCTDLEQGEIFTAGWASEFSACNSIGDWRCTFWQNGFHIVLPALIESMNLAYLIATRLSLLDPVTVVTQTTSARARAISIAKTGPSRPPAELPDPPVRGSTADLLTPPALATPSRGPFMSHQTMPPPMVTPVGIASSPPPMVTAVGTASAPQFVTNPVPQIPMPSASTPSSSMPPSASTPSSSMPPSASAPSSSMLPSASAPSSSMPAFVTHPVPQTPSPNPGGTSDGTASSPPGSGSPGQTLPWWEQDTSPFLGMQPAFVTNPELQTPASNPPPVSADLSNSTAPSSTPSHTALWVGAAVLLVGSALLASKKKAVPPPPVASAPRRRPRRSYAQSAFPA